MSETVEQSFSFLQERDITNDFIKSLETNYNKYKKLTPKQLNCLINIVNKHKENEDVLNYLLDNIENFDNKKKKFILNVSNFYNEKKFISEKQLNVLNSFLP